MYFEKWVKECDATGKKYDPPVKGAAVVARSACNRWCEVIHLGPDAVDMSKVKSYEEVVAEIEAKYPDDDIDF